MGTESDTKAPKPDDAFIRLSKLIREEWPSVDEEALAATGGEHDRVVELVAARTEHTHALVRRHLEELKQLARERPAKSRFVEDAEAALQRLGARASELARELQGQAVREAKRQVDSKPLVSLLTALGVGLLIGLFLAGGRRGRRG